MRFLALSAALLLHGCVTSPKQSFLHGYYRMDSVLNHAESEQVAPDYEMLGALKAMGNYIKKQYDIAAEEEEAPTPPYKF